MNSRDWAFAELDIRRTEWAGPDIKEMHIARRLRRQARGYSKKVADELVAWALEQEKETA